MFLRSNKKYPFGLDISDFNLKIAQLKKVRDKIKLQALGRYNLPAGVIQKGEILDKKISN